MQLALGGSHLRPGPPSPGAGRPPAAPPAPSLGLWCLLPTGPRRAPLLPDPRAGPPRVGRPGPVPREPAGWRGSPTDARGCGAAAAEPWGAGGGPVGLLRLCLPQLGALVLLLVFAFFIAALEGISVRFSPPLALRVLRVSQNARSGSLRALCPDNNV